MALIKCYECGAEISDAATQCPKCGAPVLKPIVCPDCGKQIPANSAICPNCGAPIQQQPSLQQSAPIMHQTSVSATNLQGTPQMRPDNHLVWSILNTILCCLPLGIWSIIKSNEVNRLYDSGRYEEAKKAADDASMINKVSAGLAILIYVIYIILIATGTVAAFNF